MNDLSKVAGEGGGERDDSKNAWASFDICLLRYQRAPYAHNVLCS
jgi:hypothetical protein